MILKRRQNIINKLYTRQLCCGVIFLIVPLPLCALSLSDTPVAENQTQPLVTPLIDGISSRLVPAQSETITAPKTYFSFGVYREFLVNDTPQSYAPSGLGMMLGFQQHIRGVWSGGIDLLWSDWKGKAQSGGSSLPDTSPLSLFSQIEATPTWQSQGFFGKTLRPYAVGGLGYTVFFDNRSLLAAKSKSAFGQMSATYGAGLRIILPTSFSIKMGAQQWRGVQTADYFSNIVFLQLSFGDVDKF